MTTPNNFTPPSVALRDPAVSTPQLVNPPVSLGVTNNDSTGVATGNKPAETAPPQVGSSGQAAEDHRAEAASADYWLFVLIGLAFLLLGGIICVRKLRRA